MTRRLGAGAAVTALIAAALTAGRSLGQRRRPDLPGPARGSVLRHERGGARAPSYAEAPVDCAAAHTSTIIAVVQLPDDLAYDAKGLSRSP